MPTWIHPTKEIPLDMIIVAITGKTRMELILLKTTKLDFDDEDDPEDRDLTLRSYGSVKFDGLFALGVLTIKSLDLIPVLDE